MIFSENRYPLFGIMLWRSRSPAKHVIDSMSLHKGGG